MSNPAPAPRTDLLVVGGGPAGCAAAVMAASVGMRSQIVEPGALCGKLRFIPALGNVLGGHTSGPELAAAIAADVHRCGRCEVRLGVRVTRVTAHKDRVEAALSSGERITAAYAVVATGVRPLQPSDADWVTCPAELTLPPLWEADAAPLSGRQVLLVGADRPLGTFLRAHPRADVRFLVAHPPADAYKADEVRGDPRVTLLPVRHLTLATTPAGGLRAKTTTAEGTGTHHPEAAFANLGNAPAPPEGTLTTDARGYCPPARQHPRILIAGDLRSPRNQRIMTAMGSGAEAALAAYYSSQGLPPS
mgnify:CR=1 FL=1